MTRKLEVSRERWPLSQPLVTANTTAASIEIVVARISEAGHVGRGEASGVYYHGETAAVMAAQIESMRLAVEAGADRDHLQSLLPPGGARNALDCALWELEARQEGCSVAELVGIAPASLTTVTTISLGHPHAMADQALACGEFSMLKLKLGDGDALAQVGAVRAARPDARLIADANAAWSPAELARVAGPLAELGIELLEQPCAREHDHLLDRDALPIALCADESCHTRADLPRLARGYRCICIKLDKTGGLTEALALAKEARAHGFSLMIGNMLGTSLAMAPLSVLGPWCRYIDIDGPLLLERDRAPGLRAQGDRVPPLVPEVWG